MGTAERALEAHRREIAQQVASDVAKALGLDAHAMMGRSKEPGLLYGRTRVYEKLRDRGWSYPVIGRAVGRDHSTIQKVLDRRTEPTMPTPPTEQTILIPPNVTRIRFEIALGDNGKRKEAVFLRREKIEGLLADPGSLGAFLRDLAGS